ncbi:polysaccharide pyruvyl transferase CsaB [Halobacillus litoralis]|uniref:Polysaccharide pyruvyl transferase CsaB n=1 Tax=Halobacillus litoralis TaxID=45668 RepID=A0A410MF96_9BACI|nr:polysaccharide pyruvyl transferase CsaB [Halobacillus litoralis]QAS53412.1 polysaccharide pyruvyl transferase CsaB [Halobacillus litoralis]
MKIVLSGYYGFHNTGDEAILKAMIQQLKAIEPTIHITVLSQNPAHTMETYGVDAVNRWRFKEIAKVLKESDGLISGGGSLLQDATGPRSVLYYTGIIHLAKWLKKPVYVYAQGMGPFYKKSSRRLVRLALNRVDGLSVRDRHSRQLLEEIKVSPPVHLFPDPVFGYDFHPQSIGKPAEKPVLAVSIREWKGGEKYRDKLTSILDHYSKNGFVIHFVPMHGTSDEAFSAKVAASLSEETVVHSGDLSIDVKLSIISQSHLLIGMRLHALIFAGICNVPFAALSYDPKIDALAEQLDYPVTAHVDDDSWSPQSLIEEIDRLCASLEFYKEKLSARVRPLRSEATQAPKEALACFRRHKK